MEEFKCTLGGSVLNTRATEVYNLKDLKLTENKETKNLAESHSEVCILNEKYNVIVYFKSSKLLRLHGIAFMVTIWDRERRNINVHLFRIQPETNKFITQKFKLKSMPFEARREFFIVGAMDEESIYKEVKYRLEYEYSATNKRLNGMNVF